MQSFWLLRPFFGHLFRCCRLHYQTCSHSAPTFCGLTSSLAKSRAVHSAASRGNREREACMHASCAAKAAMERRIAAPERSLQRRHQPSSPLHHQPCSPLHNPLQSPRSLLCSCLALVARVKERSQIMVLPLPHQMERRKKISLWSSAAQLFFIGSRGRGPSRTTIDSNNSSNNAGGRGVDVEQLQTAHEHPHEFPSRCW